VMGQMFGELVNGMNESHADILGDLFPGCHHLRRCWAVFHA
jgi:hypothetical protein